MRVWFVEIPNSIRAFQVLKLVSKILLVDKFQCLIKWVFQRIERPIVHPAAQISNLFLEDLARFEDFNFRNAKLDF